MLNLTMISGTSTVVEPSITKPISPKSKLKKVSSIAVNKHRLWQKSMMYLFNLYRIISKFKIYFGN